MLPKKLKSLIDNYCMGVTPTDAQMDEIMDLACEANADSAEVAAYMEKMIKGPTKESVEQPYVDLGLSVKWAKSNMGTKYPEEQGDYYSWGETKPKIEGEFTRDRYKFGYKAPFSKYQPFYQELVKKRLFLSNIYATKGDGITVLEPCDDVAHKKLKGKWRMPTVEEFQELIDNCSIAKQKLDGVMGYKFTSKIKGHTDAWIFMPYGYFQITEEGREKDYSGGYWCSTLDDEEPDCAIFLSVTPGSKPNICAHSRFSWGLIRPVLV